ncbi:helix-turn-helix domain-containing protein [Streptomyces aurantiacus]|uniref:Putative transcriptional activator NphR n=1 Tax=Streptomyces aurantiacus JA 4570 TaxID=1286094 RepID=S3ZBG9_9ACTN|nr:helix-turn-helix domain-containing protein [Streptomyces aurantiacus]EPH39954.1 putative transcriptional activator NphR [Streptomyces aurantiacus JA 4570]
MIETVLTTENLPPQERFAYWHDLTCRSLVATHVRSRDEADFRASALVRGSDTLQASTGTVRSPFTAERTRKLIRRSDPEQYLVDFVRTGASGFSLGDQETALRAGDLMLLDSSQPFRARHETGMQEVLVLPKDLLPLPPAQVAPLLARRLPGRTGIGAIFSRCLHEITEAGTRYRAADLVRLLDTAVELLGTLLAHELHLPHALSPDSQQQALLARVQSFVQQHLADPDLSPQTVADAHHISLRRLQQVLAAADMTPASLIRSKRLRQCRRSLLDPGQSHRTIQAVAARWGFINHAHFCRVFRAAYGMSPSEYRASHGSLVRESAGALHAQAWSRTP